MSKSALRKFLQYPKKFSMPVTRQAGKSAALAATYGGGPVGMFAPHAIVRLHPLEYVSGYTFVARDKRFGGVPVYKVTTKTISEIMHHERVPHTEIYFRMMDELETQAMPDLVGLAWIRRSRLDDLSTAVATMLMLGKTPVILRAFEP